MTRFALRFWSVRREKGTPWFVSDTQLIALAERKSEGALNKRQRFTGDTPEEARDYLNKYGYIVEEQ